MLALLKPLGRCAREGTAVWCKVMNSGCHSPQVSPATYSRNASGVKLRPTMPFQIIPGFLLRPCFRSKAPTLEKVHPHGICGLSGRPHTLAGPHIFPVKHLLGEIFVGLRLHPTRRPSPQFALPTPYAHCRARGILWGRLPLPRRCGKGQVSESGPPGAGIPKMSSAIRFRRNLKSTRVMPRIKRPSAMVAPKAPRT